MGGSPAKAPPDKPDRKRERIRIPKMIRVTYHMAKRTSREIMAPVRVKNRTYT